MIGTAGVIGLGNMGTGMALSLQRAGFDTRSTTATAASRAKAAEVGVCVVDGVRQVAEHAQVIVLALPGPAATLSVAEDAEGLLAHARVGQTVIDTTTSDMPTSLRLGAAFAEHGAHFIDAPVSGAPKLAREGALTMMIGGEAGEIAEVMPILTALATRQVHVGPLGSGQIVKLANNLLAAANLVAAGEMVAFVRAAGVDVGTFIDVLNASTGRSFVTERVYPDWILPERHDLGFSVGLMRKDVRLALEELGRRGISLPQAERTAEQWLGSADLVHDDEDITRILELPERTASRATTK